MSADLSSKEKAFLEAITYKENAQSVESVKVPLGDLLTTEDGIVLRNIARKDTSIQVFYFTPQKRSIYFKSENRRMDLIQIAHTFLCQTFTETADRKAINKCLRQSNTRGILVARMDERAKSITVGSIVIFCLLEEGDELSLFVDYIATDVKISLNDITGTQNHGRKKWKGQGMARRLLRLVQYIGRKEMGCITLTLISNRDARSFYERLGFSQKSFDELSKGIRKRIAEENLDQSGTLIPFCTETLSAIPPDDLIYLVTSLNNQLN